MDLFRRPPYPDSERTFAYVISPPVNVGALISFKADDLFAQTEKKRCTKGWGIITGVADFYEAKGIPSNWTTTTVPAAGGRPAKYGYWALAPAVTEGDDVKLISVKWDCISGSCVTQLRDIK